MTTTGSNTQNFNSLSNSGSNVTWINNSTIANWYASASTYDASTGSSTAGSMYSFGSSSASDRALGSLNSNTTGDIAYGVQLQNNSGVTITSMTLAYTGEEWRRESNTDKIYFYYKISTSAINSITTATSGWTSVSSLDFTGPISGSGTSLDGNNSSNRTVISAVSIPSLSLASGSYIVFKWVDLNITGTDVGIGIDDVTVSWTVPSSTNYYLQANGTISTLADWGTSTDGLTGGPAPALTTGNINWNILNNASGTPTTLTSAWSLGSSSKIIVGGGANANELVVSSASGAITGTVDVTANGTLTLNNGNVPTFGTLSSGSTVKYQPATSYSSTVTATTYSNLTVDNSLGGTLSFPSGTVGVSGTFTPTSGMSASQGTVNFSSSSAQTIPAFSYNSITNTGNGNRTFASSGTISIASGFTTGTGSYIIGTSTVAFTGSSTQTIPVPSVSSGANYYNLTYSGSSTGNIASSVIVGNDLAVSGGTLTLANNSSGTIASAVYGNVTIANAATLDFNSNNSSSNTATISLSVKKDVSIGGSGDILTSGDYSDNGTLIFNGTGTISSPQSFSLSTSSTTDRYLNYTISSGTAVQLNNNLNIQPYGVQASYYRSTIDVSGTLIMPASIAIGTAGGQTSGGTAPYLAFFNLNSGGTLVTANAGGVPGSIPVNTNLSTTYSSGANYEFRGANTGTFTTSPTALTVNNLTFNQSSGITVGQNFTVTGSLNLTSGIASTGSNKIISSSGTINGVASTSLGSSLTSWVNGKLQMPFSVSGSSQTQVFAIGDGSVYTPVSLTFSTVTTAGGVTASSSATAQSNFSSSAIDPYNYVLRIWTLTNGTVAPINYDCVLNFNSVDIQNSANTAVFIGGTYSSAWNYPTVGAKTSTSTQLTGNTQFGDFMVGEPAANRIILTEASYGPFCNSTGNNVSIDYTTTGTVTSPFVELSNSSGTFSSGTTNIGGTITLGSPNNITATIPSGQSVGTYRVRIVSTDLTPVISGNNGSDISIISSTPASPSFVAGTTSSVCQAASPSSLSISSVSGATGYQWSLSSAGSSSIAPIGSTTNTMATVTWDAAYYGSATVSVTADNVCGSSAPGSWIVTVNQNLTPAVSIAANPSGAVCSGTSVTFTATPSNLSSGSVTNYQWKKNGSNVGTNSSTYTTSSLATNDAITCVITISGGCLTSTGATSNPVTMTITTVTAAPVATAGTAIGAMSFDANWNPASGASSYMLDVATDSTFISSTNTTLADWDFESSTNRYAANAGISANIGNLLSTAGGTGTLSSASGNGGSTAVASGWDSGINTKYWELHFSTAGYYNIKISSKQRSSNTGPKNFKLQYKIGSGGTYADVTGATSITVADNYTSGVLSSVALPSGCDDQSAIYLRWIMTTNTGVNGSSVASTGNSNIDDITITGNISYYVTGYHDLGITSSPQSVTGLNISGGQQYYYRVRGVNSCGNSSYSNIITVNSCTSPDALAFLVQPSNTEQGWVMTPSVKVRAYCTATGFTANGYTGSITLSASNGGCGYVSQTVAAVEGVATFNNIVFTRSAQTGIKLSVSATGLTGANSNTFNITTPGGTPTNTSIKNETFETSSPIPWSYTIGTPSYTGSGGGTDITGIKTFSTNKVLCKSYSTDNGSSEKKSTTTITFANVTGLSTYNSVAFAFQLASLGSGNGAGTDNGDDMSIEISLDNGSTWNKLLTYYGSSDYLFALSSSSPASLAYNANQQYVSPSTQSAFSVTLPSGTSQFRFRMTAKNNRTNENWSIDNITLTGTTLSSTSPSPLPTATGGTVNSCPNTNTTISVSLSNTQGGVSYLWSPSTNISSTTVSNPVVSPSVATTYTVTITDADGCTATASEVITVPTGTAGNWTGVVNDDWFYCRNWGNGVVPDVTTDVTVNSSASNIANIDPQSSFASIYSGIAYANSLLTDNKKVNFSNSPTLIVNGNLTIQNNGLIDMTTGGTLELKGNWNNQVGSAGFTSTLGAVKFSGSATQTVSSATIGGEIFNDLTVAKTSQTLIDLSNNVIVNGILSFTGGIIRTNNNYVTIANSDRTGAISGYDAPNATGVYNNDKYVQGNLERNITGTGMYDFPVGDAVGGEGYNPVQLNILSGSATGYATAKFVAGDPGTFAVPYSNYFSCSGAGAFTEYTDMTGEGWWNFTSSTGTNFNYDIHLHPNQNNQNTYPNDAVTVGTQVYNDNYRALKAPSGSASPTFDWTNYAMLGDPCTVSSYYDIIGANYTGFSDFAPGGGFGNTTALPVELIYLEAIPIENRYIKVEWATASETNNLGFEVQRSTDGANFSPLGWVDGSNNSTTQRSYYYNDNSAVSNVLYYYRLKQQDYDGKFDYTDIVSAEIKSVAVVTVSEFVPNPTIGSSSLYINSSVESEVSIRIYDFLGRMVKVVNQSIAKGRNVVDFDFSDLAAANYSALIILNDQHILKRIVIMK